MMCSKEKNKGLELRRFLLLAALLLFTIIGCGVSVKVIKNTSRPEKPSWVERLPIASSSLYFVGIKTKASTLEEGEKEATQDALSQIANYLGTTVNYNMEIERNNHEKMVTGYIKVKSGTKVIEASIVDTYYIKTTYIGNRTIEEYDVYVLVKLPKDVIPKILAANKKEKETKVMTAYNLFVKGKALEEKRMYEQANNLYNQALDLLSDTTEIVGISDSTIKNNIELQQTLINRIREINQAMKRVLIIVDEKNMSIEREHSILADNLAEVLTKNGYILTPFPIQSMYQTNGFVSRILSGDKNTINEIAEKTGAMYIVAGRVNTTYSSEVMGQYCYYAIGDIKMIQAFGNTHTIENIPLKTSGFHQEKEQAGLNALAEAGQETGQIVVKELNKITEFKEKQK